VGLGLVADFKQSCRIGSAADAMKHLFQVAASSHAHTGQEEQVSRLEDA